MDQINSEYLYDMSHLYCYTTKIGSALVEFKSEIKLTDSEFEILCEVDSYPITVHHLWGRFAKFNENGIAEVSYLEVAEVVKGMINKGFIQTFELSDDLIKRILALQALS